MGLPNIQISFEELGVTAIKRGEKGIVALVLYDEKTTKNLNDIYEMYDANDYPDSLDEYNITQIKKTWLGYITTPRKVILAIEPLTEGVKKGDVSHASFDALENLNWDVLAIPGIEQTEIEGVGAWIKSLNDNYQKGVIAVLPNGRLDDESIVNYTTPTVTDFNDETHATTDYTARLAGLIAGTPLQISCTFAPLMELKSCTSYKKDELDSRIDLGELVLFNDGEKIKVARGVNSLVTVSENKRGGFKKIKLVQLMHLIQSDIKKAAEDNYIGKYANNYDNKVLLASAIYGYLLELERAGLAERGQSLCRIDLEAQRNYLISTGYKTKDGRGQEDWEEIDIMYGDTDDKVFLKARAKLLDAIEEIELPIEI